MGFFSVVSLSTIGFVFCIPILIYSAIPSGGVETVYLGTIIPSITLLYLSTLFTICRKRYGFSLFTLTKSQWNSEERKTVPAILTSVFNLITHYLIVLLWMGLTVFLVCLISTPTLQVALDADDQEISSSDRHLKYGILAVLCGVESVFMSLLFMRLNHYRRTSIVRSAVAPVSPGQDFERGMFQMIPTRPPSVAGRFQVDVRPPEVLYDAISGAIGMSLAIGLCEYKLRSGY